MLGLPKTTQVSKQLPKKAIYERFNMNLSQREKFDLDISRIYIINEISPATTIIDKGSNVDSIFLLLVNLKAKKFDEKNIINISKLVKQNILFILNYEDKAKLVIIHNILLQTEWLSKDDIHVKLKGTNLDLVWQNLIIDIADIDVEVGNTLDEQIEINVIRDKISKQIKRLENQARAEKQPRKKFELFQEIKRLEKELG